MFVLYYRVVSKIVILKIKEGLTIDPHHWGFDIMVNNIFSHTKFVNEPSWYFTNSCYCKQIPPKEVCPSSSLWNLLYISTNLVISGLSFLIAHWFVDGRRCWLQINYQSCVQAFSKPRCKPWIMIQGDTNGSPMKSDHFFLYTIVPSYLKRKWYL